MPIPVPVARLFIRTGLAPRLPAIRQLLGDGVRCLKYFSDRVLASPNVELRQTQQMFETQTSDAIDLTRAAPPVDRELFSTVDPGPVFHGYPPVSGLFELRERIAEKLKRENQIQADPEGEVLITSGVSQAMGLALDSFVNVGDRVVLFDPSFFMYRSAAMNRRARIRFLPTWLEEGRTRFDENLLSSALRGAKMIFINSPSNPTGGQLDRDALERIAYWCRRRDVLIFSDEVYERFVYDAEHHSIASLPAARGRVITANGFSKSHGLAPYRIGYLSASSPLMGPMLVSALATSPFVSTDSQRLALKALAQPSSSRERIRAQYLRRRNLMEIGLRGAGLPVDRPGGAFFFWVSVEGLGLSGEEFATRLFVEERVKALPGGSCGPSGARRVRLSFAASEESIQEGMARLARLTHRLAPNLIATRIATARAA